jgi:hypothetical protein
LNKLTKIKSKNIKNNIGTSFFVFDVETTKLEPMSKNFVFGVIYGNNFKKVIYSVDEFKQEFSKVKYQNKFIFAHNAEFDLMTIYGNIYENIDNKALFNGKFISAKLNKVTFGDSLNIFQSSVEKIGKSLNLEKIKNEKVFSEKLTKDNITKDDIYYCIRDCEIIYKALLSIFTKIGSIKLTIASLSMYNFRKDFLKKDIFVSDLIDNFYDSYFGGRTEVFKLGKCSALAYDINSLYPFVMSRMFFPDVSNLKKESKVDLRYLDYLLKNDEGLASVRLIHKDSYFGFIPFRSEKLLFPIGEFETVINFNELRFALDANIIEIIKCNYVVYGKRVETPFKEFIEFHYNKKVESNFELDKTIHKYISNSLYGKFGMRYKYTTEYFKELPIQEIKKLMLENKFYMLKLFSEIRLDCYLIYESKKIMNGFCSIPAYSSYITSEARIKLLSHLLDNPTVLYCDTDSIFIEDKFNGIINNEIGNFKIEKEITEIKGLKNYISKDVFGLHEVIKGISKNAIKVSDNEYRMKKFYKTKAALRQNKEAGQSYDITKILTSEYDKRIVLNNGSTKPITVRL